VGSAATGKKDKSDQESSEGETGRRRSILPMILLRRRREVGASADNNMLIRALLAHSASEFNISPGR
jgi:hypothetical protein